MKIIGEQSTTWLQLSTCHTEQSRQSSRVIRRCTVLLSSSSSSSWCKSWRNTTTKSADNSISVPMMNSPSCRGLLPMKLGFTGTTLRQSNSLHSGRANNLHDRKRWDRSAAPQSACSLPFSTFATLCINNSSPGPRPSSQGCIPAVAGMLEVLHCCARDYFKGDSV